MMEWYDQYSVHIGQMDRQHRKILSILSRIYYLGDNDRRSLESIFRGLEGYFQEHERFIDEIDGYRREFLKGRTPVMINMFNTIWDWFSRHILLLDKRYEPFLQARGCR